MASSRGMKPFVTKFHGKAQLTSTEFMAVFRKYDKDGKFFVWLKILHKLSVIPAAASDQMEFDSQILSCRAKRLLISVWIHFFLDVKQFLVEFNARSKRRTVVTNPFNAP